MTRSTWWIVAGTAAVLLGGEVRADEGEGAPTGDPSAQPEPSAPRMDEGYTTGEPAHAPVTEGAPARTSADPGSGGGDAQIRALKQAGQTDPGAWSPVGDDAAEVSAGNTGGRG